jgi:hypothetical protein
VYTFIGTKYNNPDQRVLNVIVHVRPFSEPGDVPTYDRFADDALYSIHIANPNTGKTVLRYNYRFSSVAGSTQNQNTILSYGLGTEAGPIMDVGDARQNYVQTYSVTRLGPDGLGQTGGGIDGFKGYNVLAFAIQIPVASLPDFSMRPASRKPSPNGPAG